MGEKERLEERRGRLLMWVGVVTLWLMSDPSHQAARQPSRAGRNSRATPRSTRAAELYWIAGCKTNEASADGRRMAHQWEYTLENMSGLVSLRLVTAPCE